MTDPSLPDCFQKSFVKFQFNLIWLENVGNLHVITVKLVLVRNSDLLENALLFSLSQSKQTLHILDF